MPRTCFYGKSVNKYSETFAWGNKYSELENICQENYSSRETTNIRTFAWRKGSYSAADFHRLNTKELMLRKHWNFEGGPNCVLCSRAQREDSDHLFFHCEFAQRCWDTVGVDWTLSENIRPRFLLAAQSFGNLGFVEFFASVIWNILKERNNLIFNLIPPSFASWKCHCKEDLLLHQCRPSLVQPLVDWISSVFI